MHIGLAVTAFILAFYHIDGVGYYINAPAKHSFWTAYILSWLLLIIYVRLIKPWFAGRKPYRVTQVQQDCNDCWTLALQPDGHTGMRFKPGQFAWLTLRVSPFHINDHHFSFSSSAACGDRMEFTIKELGEVAYLDGPYGVFTVDRYPQAMGFVFIAGGIGMAPIMSMLRTLADRNEQRSLLLICGKNVGKMSCSKQNYKPYRRG